MKRSWGRLGAAVSAVALLAGGLVGVAAPAQAVAPKNPYADKVKCGDDFETPLGNRTPEYAPPASKGVALCEPLGLAFWKWTVLIPGDGGPERWAALGSPTASYVPPARPQPIPVFEETNPEWNAQLMAWEWQTPCSYPISASPAFDPNVSPLPQIEALCKQDQEKGRTLMAPTYEGVSLRGVSGCSSDAWTGKIYCQASWLLLQPDGPLHYTRSWGQDKGQDRNSTISLCEEQLRLFGGTSTNSDPVSGKNIVLPADAVLVAVSTRRLAEDEKPSYFGAGDRLETDCTFSANPNAVPVKKPQSSASGSVANAWGPPVQVANPDDTVSIVITSLTSSIGAVVSGELPYGSYTIEVSSSLGHDVALSANGGGCTVKGTRLEVVKVDSTCRVEAVTTDGAGGSFSDVFEAKTVLGTQGMAFNWPTAKKQKVGKSLTLAKKNQRETSAGQTIKFSITKGKGNCTLSEAKNKSIKLKITKKGPCRVEAKAKAIKGKYKAASKKEAYQGV